MFELIKLTERTQYIASATNIGIYIEEPGYAWLIDTGIDSDTAKKILKVMESENLVVRGIICTHSHADHIGGNKLIVERTGCCVLAHGVERAVAENPELNVAAVYGAYPYKSITSKFFYSEPSGKVLELKDNLPLGLEYFTLPGHTFDMIGIRTPDNVYFLADSIVGEDIVRKYQVFFLRNIKAQLETIENLYAVVKENEEKGIEAIYVPSHSPAENTASGITELIKLNHNKILELIYLIPSLINDGNNENSKCSLEQLVKRVFDHCQLDISPTQATLITSTVKSYLSYLINEGKVQIVFEDNIMYFKLTDTFVN